MRTLIAGGTVVTASDVQRADVLVEGEKVIALGQLAPDPRVRRTIDATGKLVVPGGVDVHTHLDLPVGPFSTSDDFETGTIAAAHGGTTTIIDFATQERGKSLHAALEAWHKKADGKAAVDYGFHAAIAEWSDRVRNEMATVAAGGVTSFKLFMAYPGRLMVDDGAIFAALERARELGAMVMLHAEKGEVIEALVREALRRGATAAKYHAATRPPLTEVDAVLRAIVLAEMTDAPLYLVHLSTSEAAEAVTSARRGGLRVFGETCPQYLLLTDEEYERPGVDPAGLVMSPPLRPRGHQDRLWARLADGNLRTVASDHCPFLLRGQKDLGAEDFSKIPNGAPGIEFRTSLVYDAGVRTGRLSLTRWVDVTASSPARLFGLYPRKGTVAPGSDADLVVFDPERTLTIAAATHHMRVDYNPFEGRQVTGAPTTVMLRGQVIVEQGRFVGRAGAGQFLKRGPSPG